MSAELIISSVALVVSGLLLVSNLAIRLKNRKLILKASQAEVDRLSVYVKTQDLLKKAAEEQEGKDGFIKFMSQSRDWAFEYIETVQSDLYSLKDVYQGMGGRPKTVAHNNALIEAIEKVLTNLPEEEKK